MSTAHLPQRRTMLEREQARAERDRRRTDVASGRPPRRGRRRNGTPTPRFASGDLAVVYGAFRSVEVLIVGGIVVLLLLKLTFGS